MVQERPTVSGDIGQPATSDMSDPAASMLDLAETVKLQRGLQEKAGKREKDTDVVPSGWVPGVA